ncbi:MAG: DUF6090 family protein [Cyclobacteriaceae bacterium]
MNNKFTTYLLYGIGEIILVVIGILIAVNIDDWSENRKNQKEEKAILKDLHQEFLSNKTRLQNHLAYHKVLAEATSAIMQLIGKPTSVLAQNNLDSLIYLSIDHHDFNPSQSVISELISSGKLNLISSDELRLLIFEWESNMDEKVEAYETMDELNQNLTLPYLTKNASMKDIDFYGLGKPNGRSKFASKNENLFQQIEFENHMDNQYWCITNYINKLERLEEIIDKILEETANPTNN